MKKLALVLGLGLLSSVSFAKTQFFNHSVVADSEAAAVELAHDAIPAIISGDIKSSFQRNCFPNNATTIKVAGVDVEKKYSVSADGSLEAYYIGTVNYSHRRCRDND